jgi:RecA-family ATPase
MKDISDFAATVGRARLIETIESHAETVPTTDGLPEMIDGLDLITRPPELPAELVQGILHKGCKMVLGGASKSCKTWTLLDLGLSIAQGAEWWGFPTAKSRVLFINFELQPAFFARRALAVSEKTPEPLEAGAFTTWHLRGKNADISKLAGPILGRCKDREFGLIIFDPLYKMLGDRDENKAGDIAHLLNEFERIAVETGAAVAFGAHYSKGNQAGKESIDRIGGSGVFARDPDTILTLTAHEEKDAFTVDPVLRNHAPREPFVVRWEYPLMRLDGELNPARLKRKTGRESIYSVADILELLGTVEMKTKELARKAKEDKGMSPATFHRLLKEAEKTKKISKSKLTDQWALS